MDKDISEKSIKWIKENKTLLIERFSCLSNYPSYDKPSTFFMAGSPGAGKTEFAKGFIKQQNTEILRIDADEIKSLLPFYTGVNSDAVQAASSIGVEKIFDYAQIHRQNVLVDATFADYFKSRKNVERALGRNRHVGIIYIYQNPHLAWDFTRKREVIEGRRVPKDIFVNAFFEARENVNKVKEEFKSSLELHVVVKNIDNKAEKIYFNVNNIDNYIKLDYNKESLYEDLPDVDKNI